MVNFNLEFPAKINPLSPALVRVFDDSNRNNLNKFIRNHHQLFSVVEPFHRATAALPAAALHWLEWKVLYV